MKTNRDDIRPTDRDACACPGAVRELCITSTAIDESCPVHGVVPEDNRPHRLGWHPAPDLASLRRMEPVKKPTRDYARLLEYVKTCKGVTDDDALRVKYGGDGLRFVKTDAKIEIEPAPIPDGARGDVWPRYARGVTSVYVQANRNSRVVGLYTGGCTYRQELDGLVIIYGIEITQAQFIAKLREWKHPALAEFEDQPRKQVERRVWKSNGGMFTWALIGDGAYLFGGPSKATETWEKSKIISRDELIESMRRRCAFADDAIELHGPEADAIIRECAKAMGLI